jgi:hypothetical protein
MQAVEVNLGEVWTYQDMANGPLTYVVTGTYVTKFSSEWTLLCENGETITSDLRQNGWKKVAA